MAAEKASWYCRSWTDLHDVGSSKVVNSAFIWLVLIPFLSRVLVALSAEYGRDVKLPFNFLAFYYSAFFFTIAAAVFNWKCPTVAKLAPTFGSFKAGGYSAVELKNWYHDMVPSPVNPEFRDGQRIVQFMTNVRSVDSLTQEEYANELSRVAGPKLMVNFWLIEVPEHRLPDAHNLAVQVSNGMNPIARCAATVCYGIGFLLFAVVAVLNLVTVVQETTHHFPCPF